MIPKSFVFISIRSYNQKTTPIHSYIFPPKKILNSFVYIPIHAYIFQKKSFSNSFVYIPIQSYIFKEQMHLQFIRIYSNSLVYIPKKITPPIHLYFSIYSVIFQKKIVVQSIRMYSNLFVYIFKKQYTVEGHTEAAKVTKNEGSRE